MVYQKPGLTQICFTLGLESESKNFLFPSEGADLDSGLAECRNGDHLVIRRSD